MNSLVRLKLIKWAVVSCVAVILWVMTAAGLVDALKVKRPLRKADAILVMSGGEDYVQRANEAASQFQEGVAPEILLTNDGVRGGWDEAERRNPPFVELSESALVSRGVPRDRIQTLPGLVAGTHDEAELAVQTARREGLQSLLVVTSPYHARRTLWTFEHVKSEEQMSKLQVGVCYPDGSDFSWGPGWWLTGRGWKSVGAELVKLVYYKIIYW